MFRGVIKLSITFKTWGTEKIDLNLKEAEKMKKRNKLKIEITRLGRN